LSTPVLGRNARLYKDGTVIGYGKNISVKASAELIKDYSMDSLTPAVVGAGKQTFSWSAERLYINGAWMTLLLAGTEFPSRIFGFKLYILIYRNKIDLPVQKSGKITFQRFEIP